VASDSISYGASWADFDRDGDLDLFVANYGTVWLGQVNQFCVNNGDGTFAERGAQLGLGDEELTSTGGIWGDYDGDGWLDLYVTNKGSSGQPNRLYRNIRGEGFVRDVAAGVEDPRSSSGAAWLDFDGDGWLDLVVANTQRTALYRNFGGVFGDATESAPLALNGLIPAVADLDGDGDEDIYLGSPAGDQLLLNLSDPASALRIRLEGAAGAWGSPKDAHGARVTLAGDPTITRMVYEGSAWGQGSPVLTMPWLGDDGTVTVEWPSGTVQRVEVGGPGELTVVEARPALDLALRALALPLPLTHGESCVAVTVAVQDNGSSPLPPGIVILNVHSIQGMMVLLDSLDVGAGQEGLLTFVPAPAPPPGATYSYEVHAIAAGDEAWWNDAHFQDVTGGEPHEDFELPPVHWELSGNWRWARSSPMHPAAAGEGFLFLSAPQGQQVARSPFYWVDAGTRVAVRFASAYSLPTDSLAITVRQDGALLATTVLGGMQGSYAQQAIEFVAETTGEIQVQWSLSGSGGADPDVFFRMDEFEVTVLAEGDPETRPTTFTVSGPWPNPARDAMTWSLGLPTSSPVRLEVFDLLGRRVRSQRWDALPAGAQRLLIRTDGIVPGVYLARFTAGASSALRPFVRVP